MNASANGVPWTPSEMPATRFGRIRVGKLVVDGTFIALLTVLAALVALVAAAGSPETADLLLFSAGLAIAVPVSALLHEAAHMLTARRYGYDIYFLHLRAATFTVDWGRTSGDTTYRHLIPIVGAGPATDAVIALVSVASMLFVEPGKPVAAAFALLNVCAFVADSVPFVLKADPLIEPHCFTGGGQPNDGYVVWRSWRNVRSAQRSS